MYLYFIFKDTVGRVRVERRLNLAKLPGLLMEMSYEYR